MTAPPLIPLWKQRNFMLLWSGQLASWIGTEVSGIALPLVVLALTGSPAQAGGVAAVRGAVYVLWAIPAGIAIDRWPRKPTMFVANLGSGLAIGGIALALALDTLSVPLLLLASAVEGSFFVFANLGRFASMPNVVPKAQFPAAAAQTGTADHIAILIGPPLGGFLYGAVGGFVTFTLDALTYLINALSIAFIDAPLRGAAPAERRPIRQEIAAGFGFLWGATTLRFLNLIMAGRTLIGSGLYLLIVVLAREGGASSLSIGLIFALGAGGGILGSLVSARIHARFTLRQLLLGVTLLSSGIVALYAVAGNGYLLAAITALYYAVDTLYIVTSSSYSAATIPDALRGRVTSLTRLVTLGAHSLGFFLGGLLLQYGGSDRTIAAFTALALALLLATALNKHLATA